MGLSIVYFTGQRMRVFFINNAVFLSLKIFLILAKSSGTYGTRSKLFAKVPILGFPVYKGLSYLIAHKMKHVY